MLLQFYPTRAVDVGIGQSKLVEATIEHVDFHVIWTGSLGRKYFIDHPNVNNVDVQLVSEIHDDATTATFQITNNSRYVAMMRPDTLFYSMPVVDTFKTAFVNAEVTDVYDETPVSELELSPGLEELLMDAGYDTVESLEGIPNGDLRSIKGIGTSTVWKIKEAVQEYKDSQ